MTFGQQPQNNGQYNPQYNTSDYNTAQQNYQYAAQDTGAGTTAINTTMTYNYEEARRASVTKVYGEMTIGVIVTAIVAFIGQMTGAYYAFLASTGVIGLIALCVVQVGLAVVLGARVTKMKSAPPASCSMCTRRLWALR